MANETQSEIAKPQSGSSDSVVVSSAQDLLLAQAEQALRSDAATGQSTPYPNKMLLPKDGTNDYYSLFPDQKTVEVGYVKVNGQKTDPLGDQKSWVAMTDPQGRPLRNIENDVFSHPVQNPFGHPPVIDVKVFHDQKGTVIRTDRPGSDSSHVTSTFAFKATPDSKPVPIGSATVERTADGCVEQLTDASGKFIGKLTESTATVKMPGSFDLVKIELDTRR
jgi:hypothetical protein